VSSGFGRAFCVVFQVSGINSAGRQIHADVGIGFSLQEKLISRFETMTTAAYTKSA
jgi:hypothetical protein